MQSYRDNLSPPVRADKIAIEQGRPGLPPIIIDKEQLGRWAKLRLMGYDEKKVAARLGCTVAVFRKILRDNPELKRVWQAGPAETEEVILRQELSLITLRNGAGVSMTQWLASNFLGQVAPKGNGRGGKDDDDDDNDTAKPVFELNVSLNLPSPPNAARQTTLDPSEYWAEDAAPAKTDTGELSTPVDVPEATNGHLRTNGSSG